MYGCRLRNAWFLLLLTICGVSSLMVATALSAPLRANSTVVRVPFPLPTYGEPVCEAFPW